MKLLIVLLTYNRLAYTKKTLDSLLKTTKIPHFLVAVDNNSDDGTRGWLVEQVKELKTLDGVIFNDKNDYPGKAVNEGWRQGLIGYPQATHLMRCDNDMEFKPGWDKVAMEYFAKIPELGQLGLDHEAVEGPEAKAKEIKINGMVLNMWPGCIGGPCIIPREVWDKGIRYDESPWSPVGISLPGRPPMQEDSKFTQAIINRGYYFGHAHPEIARTFATKERWKEYPEYYLKTMEERGYKDHAATLRRLG